MNKYRIYIFLTFIFSLIVCTTQTRHSRKRYQKKKQPSTINTLIDVNSTSTNNKMISSILQNTSSVTALPISTTQNIINQHINTEEINFSYTPTPEEKRVTAPIFEEEDAEASIEFNFEHADLQ